MAMTAPAVGVLPSLPSSYATPLTPRVNATKLGLESTMAGITVPILAARTIPAPAPEVSTNGATSGSEITGVDELGVRTSLDSSDNDGRMTPVPNPDATIRRSRPPSPRSLLPPRQAPLFSSTSTSTQPPIAAPTTLAPPPATMGLGTLHGEDQLKIALQSKDRIFVVMLSKEIEAFLQRCVASETMEDAQAAVSQPGGTALSIFGTFPTVKIQSLGTSKFQRMLVYKAAEWYGAKAVGGPNNDIYLGLLGEVHEKRYGQPIDITDRSTSLKLAALVPERETIQQKFKIMQRSQPVGASRSGSSADGGDGGPTSRKTLEQREAEYAAERERIYGSTQEAEEVLDRPPPRRAEDEIDPVSRYAYGPDAMAYDPIYAPYSEIPPIDPSQAAYYANQPYPGYQMAQGMQYAAGYANGQPMYTQQAFDQHGNPIMLVPQQMGYAPVWQSQPMGGVMPQQSMQPGQMRGNGWSHSGYQQHPQMSMPPNSNGQPQAIYGYPAYPSLMHPQPQRPHPQPHSSASSSISSHSHSHHSSHSQSYHSISRPHSRGSTTSNRSAASSRFGQMYPVNPASRQKAIKGGVNGLTTLGIAQERRSTRGQSPSSTTTTSSRSSRRNNSIPVQPPGHFPLPQRPDWTKENIPYQPSPGVSPIPDTESPQLYATPQVQPGMAEYGFAQSSGPSGAASPMNGGQIRPSIPPPTTYTNGRPTDTEYSRAPPRQSQALFDPSNPTSSRPTSSNGQRHVPSFAPISAANSYTTGAGTADMSPEDIIEAKLQALSFSTGMAIGPPPVRAAPGGPSYAKVVRRE